MRYELTKVKVRKVAVSSTLWLYARYFLIEPLIHPGTWASEMLTQTATVK